MHSKHRDTRSFRLGIGRKTSPMPFWRPPPWRQPYPPAVKPLQDEHQQRSNGKRNLHRASFLNRPQKLAVRLLLHKLPPALAKKRRVPEKAPLKLCAFEEETRTQLLKDPPPHQLDLDRLELEDEKLQPQSSA